MQELSFHTLPQQYIACIDPIEDERVINIYSKFDFLSINFSYFSENCKDEEPKEIQTAFKSFLINFLKDFNFITYQINSSTQNHTNHDKNNYIHSSESSPYQFDAVICIENKILIIDEISLTLINEIIDNLRINSSIINTNFNNNDENQNIDCYMHRK